MCQTASCSSCVATCCAVRTGLHRPRDQDSPAAADTAVHGAALRRHVRRDPEQNTVRAVRVSTTGALLWGQLLGALRVIVGYARKERCFGGFGFAGPRTRGEVLLCGGETSTRGQDRLAGHPRKAYGARVIECSFSGAIPCSSQLLELSVPGAPPLGCQAVATREAPE